MNREPLQTDVQYSDEGHSSILKIGRRNPVGEDYWHADLGPDGKCTLTVIIDGRSYDYEALLLIIKDTPGQGLGVKLSDDTTE